MNILLISECTKRALTETRRILDQFAERRGERTWQTPITEAGLSTLYKLLRKTARKNTAVACHWIRARNHSELLWVVGDRNRFNYHGAVPTNTTKRDVLRSSDENDWRYGEEIRLLSGMAALLHDLGKSCKAFQDNLRNSRNSLNLLRHEWISLRLFQAFIGDDDDRGWLKRFRNLDEMQPNFWIGRLEASRVRDGVDGGALNNKPLSTLPPLAASIGWLMLTHHRLPLISDIKTIKLDYLEQPFKHIDVEWNNAHNTRWSEEFKNATRQSLQAYWTFDFGLPIANSAWYKRASRLTLRMQERYQQFQSLQSPYVMHLSRLVLMLSDHYYSSLPKQTKCSDSGGNDQDPTQELYANKDKQLNLKQILSEHLIGVAHHSDIICHAMQNFEYHLPSLLKCRALQRRSTDPRFNWQNKSADLATSVREESRRHGAFIVNMASTGCGKTLANAKVMYGLSDTKRGMRCIFALGLRVLTMQTGHSFRKQLELQEDQLKTMVGGAANRELFELYAKEAEDLGSESSQSLWDEQSSNDAFSTTSNEDYHPLLIRLTKDARIRALLNVPLLVCTIDHIMPATESKRGGHQIVPMLRLMSSDLVLDEPDDFDLSDLPALTRLVYWSGLLGSRVLLSSATLPPTFVVGLFEAYLKGRREFQLQRGSDFSEPQISCLWLDEEEQRYAQCASSQIFEEKHQSFSQHRHDWLAVQLARRTSKICRIDRAVFRSTSATSNVKRLLGRGIFDSSEEQKFYFDIAYSIRDAMMGLHRDNATVDDISKKRVSFGLVRVANIDKLYKVALALYALEGISNTRIHLCVYHSQYPLLLRSAIENQLDCALNRKEAMRVFEIPDIRNRLQDSEELDQLFVVLGSPVTEVGRDHDYDWAVIEPSSMRSLIQVAGRVRRHRTESYTKTNILILEKNIRSLQGQDVAYYKPGFEEGNQYFKLRSHSLYDLLKGIDFEHLDARARIVAPLLTTDLVKTNLVALEHARLRDVMYKNFISAPPTARSGQHSSQEIRRQISASSCWQECHAMLSALLLKHQPFRHDDYPHEEFFVLPREADQGIDLVKVLDNVGGYHFKNKQFVKLTASLLHELGDDFLESTSIIPWNAKTYLEGLEELSEKLDLSPERCAYRYGTSNLPISEQGWWFHSFLGFNRRY